MSYIKGLKKSTTYPNIQEYKSDLSAIVKSSTTNNVIFDKIMYIFECSISLANFEIADMCLNALDELYIKKKNSKYFYWKTVEEKLVLYITKTVELKKCNIENLLNYLYDVASIGWAHMISNYVNKFADILEKIIIEVCSNDEKQRQSIIFLKIYFYLFSSSKGHNWLIKMNEIIIPSLKVTNNFQDLIELFQIIFCFEKDEKYTLDLYRRIRELNHSIPQCQCYEIFLGVINGNQDYNSVNKKINNIVEQYGLLEDEISSRYIKVMKYKCEQLINKFTASTIKPETREGKTKDCNISTISKIRYTNGIRCPICDQKMKSREGSIMYLNPARNTKNVNITEYIKREILYCKYCNRVYTDDTRLLNDRYFIDENIFKSESSERYKVIEETETKRSFTKVNVFQYNTNSQLSFLGYSARLSKNERREILQRKALKVLSRGEIIRFLKYLISSRQNMKDKDFSSSINAWKTDVEMLEKINE